MTHIAVDMDDVVVDFVGGLLKAVKTEYDVDIDPEEITQWDLHPLLDPIIGRSWWAWLREREWLWATFPAIPGAIGGVDRLRRDGHYLELVTSKPAWAEHNVWKWLGLWRPPFNRVTIVDKDTRKVDATEAFVLVDDKVQNCQEFINSGRTGILFRSMQNRNAALTETPIQRDRPRAFLAEDWKAVLAIMEKTHGR